MNKFLVLIVAANFSVAAKADHSKQPINPKLMKVVDQCESKGGSDVIFIKQWHLLPSVNTNSTKAPISKSGKKDKEIEGIGKLTVIPQEKNQIAIYDQISEWINSLNASVLLAEGCSAGTEINSDFKTAFNGWTVAELQKKATEKKSANKYEKLMTHIALKVEAKFGNKIKTLCADDEELIKKSQLALSDARADASYYSRLNQFKDDPERAKTYLEGAIEGYQLPKTATVQDAITKIKASLKADIQNFRNLTDQRSVKLVNYILSKQKETANPQFVVVFGGMHTAKVKELLNQAKLGCEILEPTGYDQNEEKLIAALEESLK